MKKHEETFAITRVHHLDLQEVRDGIQGKSSLPGWRRPGDVQDGMAASWLLTDSTEKSSPGLMFIAHSNSMF